MKDTLLIYDSDPAYGRRLAEKLSLREDVSGDVHWFTDPGELLAAANSAARPLVLTVREENSPELEELIRRSKAGDCVLMYLTEIRGYSKIDDIPAVFKYRPVSLILQDIDAFASEEREPGVGPGISRARFIGVMSPVGRALKTSFCLTLGQLLSQGGRVLFSDLETCSGFPALFEREFRYDLADFLYAFETGGAGNLQTENIENFHGLDFIPPARLAEDIYRTDPVLLKKLLLELVRIQNYDLVILDLGQDYRLGETLLPLCSQIYVPIRRDPLSEAKAAEFTDWLRRMDGGEGHLRVEELVLPARQTYVGGKEYPEQLLWSELGDYVRELLGGMY